MKDNLRIIINLYNFYMYKELAAMPIHSFTSFMISPQLCVLLVTHVFRYFLQLI